MLNCVIVVKIIRYLLITIQLNMDKLKILWADDEVELLKPHILFLNSKGYDVITALSGDEAFDIVK